MLRRPSVFNKLSKKIQKKINHENRKSTHYHHRNYKANGTVLTGTTRTKLT